MVTYNRELLENYRKCANSKEVVEVQRQYMDTVANEHAERSRHKVTYQSIGDDATAADGTTSKGNNIHKRLPFSAVIINTIINQSSLVNHISSLLIIIYDGNRN